jgi:hypothetical protein
MQRYPSAHHWHLFEIYRTLPYPMSPDVFLQRWNVNYSELSRLCQASSSTVQHWFLLNKRSRRIPKDHHCRRLAEIDLLWQRSELILPEQLCRWRSTGRDR